MSLLLPELPSRGPVNWRSVLLGVLAVVLICGLTPYNDYVVNNTYLVGNFLPVGLLLVFVTFSLAVNGPLRRWVPGVALTTAELSVAFAMGLVACALPSSGLMRYLPGSLVSLHALGGRNSDYLELLGRLPLPGWLFPATVSGRTDVLSRGNDPVVTYYLGRIPEQAETWWGRFSAVPWGAWLTPALVWGVLAAGVLGMVLCMAVIVRRQWVDNERLPFPLAGVFQSLIEQPEKGKALNPLLGSRLFWVGFFLVFVIHSTNALHNFFPRFVPEISRGYALWGVLSSGPLGYTEWHVKAQSLYFSVIGLVFFLQSSVSFSLWFFVVAVQGVAMVQGTYQTQMTDGMRYDQNFGSVAAFAASIVFVGRAHWVLVMRQMVRGARIHEPHGRYLSYPVAGWGMLGCMAVVWGWMVAAGAGPVAAGATVLLLLMFFVVVARVVAETGIPFVQFETRLFRFWTLLAPTGMKAGGTSFFLSSWVGGLFTYDPRESAAVFVTQAIRVADQSAYDDTAPGGRPWHRTWPLAACLAGALSLGFVTAGASMLYVEYSYASTVDRSGQTPINGHGVNVMPEDLVLKPSVNYARDTGVVTEQHSNLGHFSFGAGLTAFLAAMRLRFTAWPFHPVGFLLVYTYPMKMIWFSVFVGWVCKTLTVRFGGIELFRTLRPLFVGLIVGEAGAVAFWLVVNLVLLQMGITFHQTSILPG